MIKFRNVMAKPKAGKEIGRSHYLVGNELNDISLGKIILKSPFDKNVVSHPGLMEHVLDYAFAQLGNSAERIEHPVFMTEPLCNTLSAREKISELMFECYLVPALAYGVDSILGYYYDCHRQKRDITYGLIVSLQNVCNKETIAVTTPGVKWD